MSQQMIELVAQILFDEEYTRRVNDITSLRDLQSDEALESVVSFLSSPNQGIRRRAARMLGMFDPLPARHAEIIADHLLHNEDPAVRLSCAISLMCVRSPAVDGVFLKAMADPFEEVVRVACTELGGRNCPEGIELLRNALRHPSWSVRMEACKGLIMRGAADQRVVDALETMRLEPEATVYDAREEEIDLMNAEIESQFGPHNSLGETWGKMESLVARARANAQAHSCQSLS